MGKIQRSHVPSIFCVNNLIPFLLFAASAKITCALFGLALKANLLLVAKYFQTNPGLALNTSILLRVEALNPFQYCPEPWKVGIPEGAESPAPERMRIRFEELRWRMKLLIEVCVAQVGVGESESLILGRWVGIGGVIVLELRF